MGAGHKGNNYCLTRTLAQVLIRTGKWLGNIENFGAENIFNIIL